MERLVEVGFGERVELTLRHADGSLVRAQAVNVFAQCLSHLYFDGM